MASNLKSAKDAIEAELSHARQGCAYYSSLVEALETALHQLESVEKGVSVSRSESKAQLNGKKLTAHEQKRSRKSSGAAREKSARRRSVANGASRQQRADVKLNMRRGTAPGASEADALPTTGGDFWLGLVTDEPKSAVDISKAAIAALGIKPDQKRNIQKLKQRVSPALAGLLSAHKIQDSGSGRERRFFKIENQNQL